MIPLPKLIKENCQLSLLFVFAVSFYSQAEKQERVNEESLKKLMNRRGKRKKVRIELKAIE